MSNLDMLELSEAQRTVLPLFLQKIYTLRTPTSISQNFSLVVNEKLGSSTLQNYRSEKPISKILNIELNK